jgi:hypothetical protein
MLANPIHPLYRALSLMLQWRVLAKTKAVIERFDVKLKTLASVPRDRAGVVKFLCRSLGARCKSLWRAVFSRISL